MLRSCLSYLGSPICFDNKDLKNSRERDHQLEAGFGSISLNSTSFHSKKMFVRVVHAGGKVDYYPNAILASKLLEELPAGKCLTRPEVFKHPHQSLLCPQDYLLPGHKYLVVPLSTVDKLKRKDNNNETVKGGDNKRVDRRRKSREVEAAASADGESFCSANDFYVRKEKWSRCDVVRKEVPRRRSVLPPIPVLVPKPKTLHAYNWEPRLTSIQEVSP